MFIVSLVLRQALILIGRSACSFWQETEDKHADSLDFKEGKIHAVVRHSMHSREPPSMHSSDNVQRVANQLLTQYEHACV